MKVNLLLLIFLILSACQDDSAPPPNVILIMVDDLGSADLGCYGTKDIQTPHIDQLAGEGVRFTQAYSGNTVCAPARSTLMTGQHSGHTPVRGNTGGIPLPDEAFTLAELFKPAGYVTGGFGKWGLGEIGTGGVPEKQGFDRFFGYYHQIHAHDYYPDFLWDNSVSVNLPGQDNDPASYSAYRIAEETKNFIINHRDKPFFCYAPWTLPHGQYVIPDADPAVQLYTDRNWDDKRKNYAAMTSLLDRQVGEVVQLLRELKLEHNTLLILCSDNGGDREFSGYRPNGELRGFKRDLYEGGIRIPLLVRWPGKIPAGAEIDLPVYFPDFMPTLAEAAGLQQQLPAGLDGRSFYPWLLDPARPAPDRYLYWEYPHYDWTEKTYPGKDFKQALRYRHWKMIRNGLDQAWEFYDLLSDPLETDNVAVYHPGKMEKFQEWIQNNRSEAPPQTEPDRMNGHPYRSRRSED